LTTFASFDLKATSLAVLDAMGIETPTPIQEQSIPDLMDGADLIGQAQTGSGKTLAFGLPLVEGCDPRSKVVQSLVLVPTRELATQVAGVLAELAAPAGLTVVVIYGGVGMVPQIEALKRGAQIVVGTPGRVLDLLQRRVLSLANVDFLVLDEADQMLDQGFAPDVERIISTTPANRQTVLFSATTPDWVLRVAAKHLNDPVHVTVDAEESEPNIEHSVVECWDGDKITALLALLDQPSDATLVFGRTRRGVTNLASRLRNKGYRVEALQGDLGQAARDKIVQRFREGRLPVLLATNVAARGLDMLNIDRVINYDLPETSELFVHRVGRTARMGRFGRAITLVSATDLVKLHEIERHLGRKLPRMSINDLARLAPKVSAVSAREIEPEAAPAPELIAAGVTSEAPAEAAKRRRRRRKPARPVGEAAAASA
jgi:ATP-dependent RNA helicase DeaD